MITRLRTKNFKSWKDTKELRLAPLTGLFGTNSSGKTSILQALLMLKQTVESPDRKQVLYTGDYRDLVDLGTFYDFIYDHQPDASLLLSLSWDLPEPLVINDSERSRTPLYNIKSLSFTTSIHEESHRPVVESFSYQLNSHRFGMTRENSARNAEKDRYTL